MFFPLEGKYSEIFSLKTKKSKKKKREKVWNTFVKVLGMKTQQC